MTKTKKETKLLKKKFLGKTMDDAELLKSLTAITKSKWNAISSTTTKDLLGMTGGLSEFLAENFRLDLPDDKIKVYGFWRSTKKEEHINELVFVSVPGSFYCTYRNGWEGGHSFWIANRDLETFLEAI